MAVPPTRADGDGSGSGNSTDEATEDVSPAELVVMAVSIGFTVALFAFTAWQIVAAPGALPPQAGVVDTHTRPDGSTVYTVELRNPGDSGLVSATVTVECASTSVDLLFEHVPPGGLRSGIAVCPEATGAPTVRVESWIRPD